jgi:hypothetical protein
MAKLSKVDAAKAAGVSRQTLYTYIKDGRLSVDADGLVDTAELLRAGFALHTGHDIGRLEVDTVGHGLTSRLDTLDVYQDMITMLKQQLSEAQAREQAALEREKTAREREALLLQMLQDTQHRYDRLLDMPRPALPSRNRTRRPQEPRKPLDVPQVPRHPRDRPRGSQRPRAGTSAAPCAGALWPCCRTIPRASRLPRCGPCWGSSGAWPIRAWGCGAMGWCSGWGEENMWQ